MAIVRVALLLLGASVASAQVTCTSSYGDFWVRWCNDNCNHEPPFCPFPWCDCSADMPDGMSGNANLFPHIHDVDQCCLETSKIWFTAGGGDLYYVSFDGTSGNVGMPTLCYEFENAVDIAIEDNGGVFVADFNDAKVWFVNSDCSNRVVVTSWHEHQISAPISISIGSDPQCDGSGCARGLYVASSPNIMNFIRLDHDDNGMFVYNSHFFVKIFNRVEDFEFDKDTGDVWHIAGDSIYKNDQLWLDGQTFRIPDLMGLHVSPFGCGLFFSATDLNQVWRCTDLDDPTSCARFCQKAGIDTDTCEGTWNPWGVTGDCACNFYYANKAGGSISVLPYFTHNDTGLPTNFLVLDNIWHPQAVEVFVPKNCSLPLPSSTS